VFENRVLRRIFEPKRDEVIAGLRKVHNEDHVARMGRRGLHVGFWWESQKERHPY
jgi:hypothetical protein